MIGRLWNGLKDRSIQDKVNIILVGDHGMVIEYHFPEVQVQTWPGSLRCVPAKRRHFTLMIPFPIQENEWVPPKMTRAICYTTEIRVEFNLR